MQKSKPAPPNLLDFYGLRSTVSTTIAHPEQLLEYRQDEFLRMRFADYMAAMLASTHIDLHQMEDLLKKGCSHDLAAQILMGTMCGDSREAYSGEDSRWGWTDPVRLEELVAS
jgi:hypothetical protein